VADNSPKFRAQKNRTGLLFIIFGSFVPEMMSILMFILFLSKLNIGTAYFVSTQVRISQFPNRVSVKEAIFDEKIPVEYRKLFLELELKLEVSKRELEVKDKEMENLRTHLRFAEKEKLRANGLMTSRGIFERRIYEVASIDYGEKKKKTNVTEICRKLDSSTLSELLIDKPLAHRLKDDASRCGVSRLADIYAKLSEEIHGYPWSGESVKVYFNSSSSEACLMMKLADSFGLPTEIVNSFE
jgi:flagellar motility protein MotE (MotC chaperone)